MNLTIIGIGLLIIVWYIHTRPKFMFKRRLMISLISISGILLFYQYGAPALNIEFSLKENLGFLIPTTIFTAIVSDMIFKKEK